MLNIFSTLRSAICIPINFVTTQIGNLFSKIKSVALSIFNSKDRFFNSGSIYQRCASLCGRVTVGNILKDRPSNERQKLLTILGEWGFYTPEWLPLRIMQIFEPTPLMAETGIAREIMACYDQKKTSMRIQGSQLSNLPDIFALKGFSGLTSLDLDGFLSLRTLPESIGNLTALTSINLDGFQSLGTLPESIGNLTALTSLELHIYNSLTALPESIGNLTALTNLDLTNCFRIAALPESIGNLTALTSLDLSYCNSLTALPESIGNLTALVRLNLDNCQSLTGLPNAILSLPSSCTIDITGCRFSQAIMDSLSASTRANGYRGPQIQYSMQAPTTTAVAQSLGEWFTSTFRNANLEEEALPNLLALDESNRRTIATWLSRMTDTADANSAGKTGFYQLIVNYLKLANANAEFRGVFLQVLHGASTTCGDRVSLSVLHLGIAAKKTTCDKRDMKAYAELLRGLIALGLLEELARGKVQTLRFVDEIEVYLGYPVMLKEALNLPIDIQGMRFFAFSGITSQDLREAEGYVLSHLGTQEGLLAQLIKNNDWLDALKAKHPTEFASIKAARDAASESDDADYDAIGRVYDQALIELSRRALG